jgi:hypothetical protein
MVVYPLQYFLLSKTSISKKEATFDLPGPETDLHGNIMGESGPLITTLDDPNKQASITSYKKPKLPEACKALERAGFKFTGYH